MGGKIGALSSFKAVRIFFPFASFIRDSDIYEKFSEVVLI